MRWIVTSLTGLILLPATAGLSRALFDFLVGLQADGTTLQGVIFFLTGAGIWILVFVFLKRPVRLYILSHELCHLLAAWATGVRGGAMEIHKDGGSVEVDRTTFWIAMAPYLVPFYSLLLILGFSFMPNRTDPLVAWNIMPGLLGLTWSFHLTFTLYAISQPQSDFTSYGRVGSLSIILFVNLLLLTLFAAISHPMPFAGEMQQVLEAVLGSYEWVWEQILNLNLQ